MPIPVIPLVAAGGLAALLFAGSKEAKPSAAPSANGVTATPTTASTGGENGGAQMPSHADVGAQGGEVNMDVGSRGDTNNGYLTPPTRSVPGAPINDPTSTAGLETIGVRTTIGTSEGSVVGGGVDAAPTGTRLADSATRGGLEGLEPTSDVGKNVLRDFWNNTVGWSGAVW